MWLVLDGPLFDPDVATYFDLEDGQVVARTGETGTYTVAGSELHLNGTGGKDRATNRDDVARPAPEGWCPRNPAPEYIFIKNGALPGVSGIVR